MDKLVEKDAKVSSMFDKIHDAMWGSDPYFPYWNSGGHVAKPVKPKFDQRAYRCAASGLVRFFPAGIMKGKFDWAETKVNEHVCDHYDTRLPNEEAERIWNTRPEAKKGNQIALEYELKYDDDGSGLFIATFGEKEKEEMTVIPAPKRPTKPATVPYSGGSKPEPKLEWKVEECNIAIMQGEFQVSLLVDGKFHSGMGTWRTRGIFTSSERAIKKAKKQLLHDYNLCKRESGRVDNN